MDQTHIGPVMDEIVARTRRRMAPAGLDDDYDLAHDHFDVPTSCSGLVTC